MTIKITTGAWSVVILIKNATSDLAILIAKKTDGIKSEATNDQKIVITIRHPGDHVVTILTAVIDTLVEVRLGVLRRDFRVVFVYFIFMYFILYFIYSVHFIALNKILRGF